MSIAATYRVDERSKLKSQIGSLFYKRVDGSIKDRFHDMIYKELTGELPHNIINFPYDQLSEYKEYRTYFYHTPAEELIYGSYASFAIDIPSQYNLETALTLGNKCYCSCNSNNCKKSVISCNVNVTPAFVADHPEINWCYRCLSRYSTINEKVKWLTRDCIYNKNIDSDVQKEYLGKDYDKSIRIMLSWRSGMKDYLVRKTDIPISKLPWDIQWYIPHIVANPNITLNDIITHEVSYDLPIYPKKEIVDHMRSQLIINDDEDLPIWKRFSDWNDDKQLTITLLACLYKEVRDYVYNYPLHTIEYNRFINNFIVRKKFPWRLVKDMIEDVFVFPVSAEELRSQKVHIKYAPGNSGYASAKKSFERI